MDSFQWDKNFITGLDDVDEQHHKLVDLINQFGEQLTSNKLVLSDIRSVLNELFEYAHYHFQDEQELMKQKGVDKRHVELQTEAHTYFLNEITSLQSSIAIDNTESLKYLLDFLTQWLAYHILGADQNMAKQIACIDAGMSPEQAYEKEESETDSATAPLLKALNGLFGQISERNNQLIALNQSLEEKVRQRTQALITANAQLEKISVTDALTGLPNRRFAMQVLSQLWDESNQNKQALSCMMLDADHFKIINDTYGHDAGDDVLCALATQLQHAVRTDDIVCRLGGDEFLIICPHTALGGLLQVAEKLHAKVASMIVPTGDGAWHGSVSVGLAEKSAQMQHFADLIKQADRAVYLAKGAGKNCIKTA